MISTIPAVVAVLALTGVVAVTWRAWRALRRGKDGAAEQDPVLARLGAVTHLVWTVFLLVHFVLLAALSESKEVGALLSGIGSAVSILALAAALGSLLAALRAER